MAQQDAGGHALRGWEERPAASKQETFGVGIANRTLQLYFNYVYNPLYDYTTAQTSPYRRLQHACIDRLALPGGSRVLCVGVGTGNEIPIILKSNPLIKLVGVDMSPRALKRAGDKARKLGKTIELHRMDAGRLEFAEGSFDRVLCLHLMDFVPDGRQVTAEIVRVLTKGGRFSITYPSGSGGPGLLVDIGKNIWGNLVHGRFISASKEFVAIVGGTLLYGPTALWLRGRRNFYTRESLERLLPEMNIKEFCLDEDRLYQDYIASGTK